jgi:hypothetical protein
MPSSNSMQFSLRGLFLIVTAFACFFGAIALVGWFSAMLLASALALFVMALMRGRTAPTISALTGGMLAPNLAAVAVGQITVYELPGWTQPWLPPAFWLIATACCMLALSKRPPSDRKGAASAAIVVGIVFSCAALLLTAPGTQMPFSAKYCELRYPGNVVVRGWYDSLWRLEMRHVWIRSGSNDCTLELHTEHGSVPISQITPEIIRSLGGTTWTADKGTVGGGLAGKCGSSSRMYGGVQCQFWNDKITYFEYGSGNDCDRLENLRISLPAHGRLFLPASHGEVIRLLGKPQQEVIDRAGDGP